MMRHDQGIENYHHVLFTVFHIVGLYLTKGAFTSGVDNLSGLAELSAVTNTTSNIFSSSLEEYVADIGGTEVISKCGPFLLEVWCILCLADYCTDRNQLPCRMGASGHFWRQSLQLLQE